MLKQFIVYNFVFTHLLVRYLLLPGIVFNSSDVWQFGTDVSHINTAYIICGRISELGLAPRFIILYRREVVQMVERDHFKVFKAYLGIYLLICGR